MPWVKRVLFIHSNPVNVVGALTVFYGLIKGSLQTVLLGAVVWTIGFVYQKRVLRKRD